MLIEVALQLLAYVTGAALHIFLASLLVRKLRSGTLERLFFGAVVGAALWHAGEAAAFFYRINSDTEDSLFLSVAEAVAKAGLITAPAFLFHLGVASGRLPKWLALLGYGLVPVAAWLLEADGGQGPRYLLVAALTAVALLCVRAARGEKSLRLRRFLSSFAIALAIPAGGGACNRYARGEDLVVACTVRLLRSLRAALQLSGLADSAAARVRVHAGVVRRVLSVWRAQAGGLCRRRV